MQKKDKWLGSANVLELKEKLKRYETSLLLKEKEKDQEKKEKVDKQKQIDRLQKAITRDQEEFKNKENDLKAQSRKDKVLIQQLKQQVETLENRLKNRVDGQGQVNKKANSSAQKANEIVQNQNQTQLRYENKMLKDLLSKIQSELCGSVNGGLDALSKLDVHRDDWLPQAVRNCRITE